ncbi:MAG: NfeD family protein [Paludibacteraceae bacterium]|nr:NfeD family protein [Paludibacteraceae bacterium]
MVDTFLDWFNNLEPGIKVYWAIALVTSTIFVIQTILSLIGLGDFDMDIDLDGGDALDSSGFSDMLSIKNAINFLLGFSWAGVCFYDSIPNSIILGIVAFLCGLAFVAMFIYLFKKMMKLESNGAFDINTAEGKTCNVYLRIPANRTGTGKVQISFSGSVQELDAVTDGEMIPTGTKVVVMEVLNNNTLHVEKL